MLSFLRYLFKYRRKTVDHLMLSISLAAGLAVLFHIGDSTDLALEQYFNSAIPWVFYGLFLLSFFRTVSAIIAKRQVAVSHYGGIALIVYFTFVTIGQGSNHP